MKSAIITTAFLAAILPSIAMADFDTSLKYGSTGPKVLEMQEFLVDQGYMTYQPTGNFYSITLRAVKAFQAAQSIQPVSGFWGPLTRAAAQSVLDNELQQSNLQASTTPVVVPEPTAPAQTIVPTQSAPTQQAAPVQQSAPVQTTQIAAAPQATTSLAHIDVIDIGAWQDGQNAPHFAAATGTPSWDAAPDGTFISVGAVVYGADGFVDKADQLLVQASDSTQNKELDHATACNPSLCYYPYHYLFKTAGNHSITFTANGTSTSIYLTVNPAQF